MPDKTPDKNPNDKTKKKPGQPDERYKELIAERNITVSLEENYMPYAMSVIVSRAIPEIDGFKPAHRKLLYTMYRMGLMTGHRIKSADVVGQTMRLNPHGDAAIYETLVRLTHGNEALLHPFIDSKGNFGKQYSRDMAYAASRYTEVKLDGICAEIFRDIDKDTVDFIDNYNGTMKEPVLFPTAFPNLLVTPNQGIAVGMASSVCSFNLKEVCAAAIAFIRDPECDIGKHLLAPDFSTGGQLVYNKREMDAVYETGRGGFRVRAKYAFDSKNGCIEITELPYTTTIEAVIDKVVSLVKGGKLRDVNDIRDETDLNGLKIAIDIKKSANTDHIMQRLYNMTPLCDSFSCNFNILINGRPKTLGVREILREWHVFRAGCIRRQIRYDIGKKEEKLHLLEGLAGILLDIDKAIRIIRETPEDRLVIPNLMEGFGIDAPQAEFIAEIRLRNLNKEYLLNRVNERDSLKKELAVLSGTLADAKKIDAMIIAQLQEISRKYGKPRRTEIVTEEGIGEVPHEDLIADYGVRLFLTAHSYFKKIPLTSLRSFGEQYLKDDDTVIQELETSNKNEILFFSGAQNVYKAKLHELPDCKASSIGEFLQNLLGMDEGERIVGMAAAGDYSGMMIFAFENGKLAKVPLESYATKVNRRKLVSAYSDKSPLVYIEHAREDADLVLIRSDDKVMLLNTALIPLNVTKNSGGVQAFNLRRNSHIARVMPAGRFNSADPEYYRAAAIPSAGHFITEGDRARNDFRRRLRLFD